jgi:arylsulfatase A-like enzyme
LFTGQYSFQHGVEARSETGPDGKTNIVEPAVPDSATMLAETLRAAGYSTAAFTANVAYMSTRWNLAQGFDTYEVERRPGAAMLKPIESWLGGHRNRPFFLFVNFMDAHLPYNTIPCPGAFNEPVPQDNSLVKKLLEAVLPGEKPAEDSLVRDVTAQYDMGIANDDHAVRQLIAALKQSNLYDESLIIVTSDHGEFLGEHLLAQHSKDLYEQVLHVPLLVKLPRQQTGQWNDRPVSLVQLHGTIQRVLNVQDLPGAPHLDDARPFLAEINYSRPWDINNPIWGHRFQRLRTAYYELPWKFIHSSDGSHELYNLAEDPSESKNRVNELPELSANLLARLEAIKPLSAEPHLTNRLPPELTKQDREALRANGYL